MVSAIPMVAGGPSAFTSKKRSSGPAMSSAFNTSWQPWTLLVLLLLLHAMYPATGNSRNDAYELLHDSYELLVSGQLTPRQQQQQKQQRLVPTKTSRNDDSNDTERFLGLESGILLGRSFSSSHTSFDDDDDQGHLQRLYPLSTTVRPRETSDDGDGEGVDWMDGLVRTGDGVWSDDSFILSQHIHDISSHTAPKHSAEDNPRSHGTGSSSPDRWHNDGPHLRQGLQQV